MFRSITNNTSKNLSAGGTISGDLTIDGDLTVQGSATNAYDEQVQGRFDVLIDAADGGTTPFIKIIDADDDTTANTKSQILWGKYHSGTSVGDMASIDVGTSEWGDSSGNRHTYMTFNTVADGNIGERVRITDVGNVGIGCTPDAVLTVAESAAKRIQFRLVDGQAGIQATNNSDSNDTFRIKGYRVDIGNSAGDLYVNESGNVRLGGSPAAMHADYSLLQVGSTGTIFSQTASAAGKSMFVGQNVFRHTDGTWDVIVEDEQTLYEQNAGVHWFYSGASHASVATLVTNMKIDINSRISLSNNDGNTNNTVFGYRALTNAGTVLGNVGADHNVAVGHLAMGTGTTTTAEQNVAVGNLALEDITTGNHNIAIGSSASAGITTANDTVFIGGNAGQAVTVTGTSNVSDGTVGIGKSALAALTSGQMNLAIGYKSLEDNQTGSYNTAVGYTALSNTTNNYNTAVGYASLISTVGGGGNTAMGHESLYANATTSNNTGIGYQAGFYTTGASNTYVGHSAGKGAAGAETHNTGVGANALLKITDGGFNVAIGSRSGEDLTTGDQNTFVGDYAGHTGSTLNKCVAVGHEALGSGTPTGEGSVAVGFQALAVCAGGVGNTGVGFKAGQLLAAGQANTVIGYESLFTEDVGTGTTAIGYRACYYQNSDDSDEATGNTAVGYAAMHINVDGQFNTAVGYQALHDMEPAGDNTGHNTGLGFKAGKYISTGLDNTFVGANAGEGIVGTKLTGNSNTAIGSSAGVELEGAAHSNTFVGTLAGNTTEAGVENTCLGYNTEAQDDTATNQIVIGNNLIGTKDNAVFIGNDSSHIENDFNSDATWNHSSDRRQKTDIKDETLGLEFINDLRPVTYKHKSPSEFPKEWDSYDADDKEPMGGDKTIHGFIAQEVKEAMDNAGVDTFQGWSDGKDGRQRVSFEAMVMPLIKSVQELSSKVEDLEKQLKDK